MGCRVRVASLFSRRGLDSGGHTTAYYIVSYPVATRRLSQVLVWVT